MENIKALSIRILNQVPTFIIPETYVHHSANFIFLICQKKALILASKLL